jgi:hypothetical protein
MPGDTTRRDYSSGEYQARLREIFSRNRVKQMIAERGTSFGDQLRTFEDRMQQGETVALFSYGSNSEKEMAELFEEKRAKPDFPFAGEVELKGGALAFGSKSINRGCPVATIQSSVETSSMPGHIILVDKKQFQAVAYRECGPTLGREKGKGRYRRAVVWLDDPRDPSEEMQAVTFVLAEGHKDLQDNPIDTAERTRTRLGSSPEALKFRAYTSLIVEQRQQAKKKQGEVLFGGPAIVAHWHSRQVR